MKRAPKKLDKETLKAWLLESRAEILTYFSLQHDWWPSSEERNQSYATAWANALFIKAATEIFPDVNEYAIHCSKGGQDTRSEAVIWYAQQDGWSPRQIMLDFVVASWGERVPFKLVAESEMYPSTSTAPFYDDGAGYLWDFFKLLVVPCGYRLFMARVGGRRGGASTIQRMSSVSNQMVELYSRYHGGLIQADDQLGCIIIPSSAKFRKMSRVLWAENGALHCEEFSDFSLDSEVE
ncbi:MAG: hypothetical protein R3B09_26325 [Nannocystaceae bacterium]